MLSVENPNQATERLDAMKKLITGIAMLCLSAVANANHNGGNDTADTAWNANCNASFQSGCAKSSTLSSGSNTTVATGSTTTFSSGGFAAPAGEFGSSRLEGFAISLLVAGSAGLGLRSRGKGRNQDQADASERTGDTLPS